MEEDIFNDELPEESAATAPEKAERGWSENMLRLLEKDEYSPDDFIIDRSDLLPLSDKGIFDDEDD